MRDSGFLRGSFLLVGTYARTSVLAAHASAAEDTCNLPPLARTRQGWGTPFRLWDILRGEWERMGHPPMNGKGWATRPVPRLPLSGTKAGERPVCPQVPRGTSRLSPGSSGSSGYQYYRIPKAIRDAASKVGVSARALGDAVEQYKHDNGLPPDFNLPYSTILAIAEELKQGGYYSK